MKIIRLLKQHVGIIGGVCPIIVIVIASGSINVGNGTSIDAMGTHAHPSAILRPVDAGIVISQQGCGECIERTPLVV